MKQNKNDIPSNKTDIMDRKLLFYLQCFSQESDNLCHSIELPFIKERPVSLRDEEKYLFYVLNTTNIRNIYWTMKVSLLHQASIVPLLGLEMHYG